ncbi:MAG TPA: dihydrofolate reductase family protein [Candidatus Peribacteraceae bacterium]|nr:dihydrofolate reductase family protein [Candidatus Peribacteraceae bacterium]
MRKIITTTFVTMDGVMQAPGGSTEDTASGFKYGGWQFGADYQDEVAGKVIHDFMTAPFELLLGRLTYEIFAGYWPNHPEIELIATPFNSTRKYVVSHTSIPLPWNNSALISGDVVADIQKLKSMDAPDLWVWGSGNLIQTLLKHNLIDRMHIWIHPLTIGTGKKLFAEGTQPERFKSVDTKITSSGVIIATYEPGGELKTGTAGE